MVFHVLENQNSLRRDELFEGTGPWRVNTNIQTKPMKVEDLKLRAVKEV